MSKSIQFEAQSSASSESSRSPRPAPVSWIVQRKIQRSDWETIARVVGGTKASAVKRYDYLPVDKMRAVSPEQAQSDYLAGRADNYKRVLEQKAAV